MRCRLAKFFAHVTDVRCGFCQAEDESLDHLFFQCSWSWELWRVAALWWQFRHASSYEEFLSNIKKLKRPRTYKNITMAIIAATLYQIWHAGNTSIFKSQFMPVQRAFHQLIEHLTHRILFLNLRSQKYTMYIDRITS